jgi:hypothetical protein
VVRGDPLTDWSEPAELALFMAAVVAAVNLEELLAAALALKASSSSPIRQLITSSYSSNKNVNVLYIRDIHICSC